MDHEFPLDVNWNSTFVDILTAHALSIMLVLGAIGCVSLQKRRPPKDSSIWFWAFAMAGSLIAFSMIAASLRTRSPLADNSFFYRLQNNVLARWSSRNVGDALSSQNNQPGHIILFRFSEPLILTLYCLYKRDLSRDSSLRSFPK